MYRTQFMVRATRNPKMRPYGSFRPRARGGSAERRFPGPARMPMEPPRRHTKGTVATDIHALAVGRSALNNSSFQQSSRPLPYVAQHIVQTKSRSLRMTPTGAVDSAYPSDHCNRQSTLEHSARRLSGLFQAPSYRTR